MSQDMLSQWLNLQPATVKKGMTVRTKDEVGALYHMSLDGGIGKFTPFITRRTGGKENISVPRVSTAPSIMGCFIGYCSGWSDMAWPELKDKKHKNGWYLYEIPYEYCIKPNTKLLFDQEQTDEHWLVTYSPETREYKQRIVAKMFYSEMTLLPRTGKFPEHRIKMVVEVMTDEGVLLGGTQRLGKGMWTVEGPSFEGHGQWDDLKPYTITSISQGEYMALKGHVASMLSAEEPKTFKDIFPRFEMPEEGRKEMDADSDASIDTHEDVSMEGIASTVKNALTGAVLKNTGEAEGLLRKLSGLKDRKGTLQNKALAEVVRPDQSDLGKDPVKYSNQLVDLLDYLYDPAAEGEVAKWFDQVEKGLARLNKVKSMEEFETVLIEVSKTLPASRLDRMPSNILKTPSPGERLRFLMDKGTVIEDGKLLPGFDRFIAKGTQAHANVKANQRPPYTGSGELPALTVREIETILKLYLRAAKLLRQAGKLPDFHRMVTNATPRMKVGVFGEYPGTSSMDYWMWAKYRNEPVYKVYASWRAVIRWFEAVNIFTGLIITKPEQRYLEALFTWAKMSVEVHTTQVSQESLSGILLPASAVPLSFKW